MSDLQGRRALAENLDRLFDAIRPEGPRGRRYTNEEVATAVKAAHPGLRVGGAYLSALRKGTKRNPSTELLNALARFFGVPASYFLDERTAARTDAEIELARVAHNLGVRRLALRALELSPEGLAAVTRIVEHVLESDPGARTRSAHPAPGAALPDVPDARSAER
ncbi:XRE family transcriptional regulator [Streptomyces sp. TRM 70361]|uniref:XRE family transcriptional regulator n=1 Tax=Streptomyces sp. TRM 70361 TaxID=3116553 RepID=UPI002E7AB373|nr:XRE family transcriptional regulator [Streptomyces sp. TRM 70361]MEE1938017.1 XRE family transcriptional regulator [Streptomyces sp. TRM 70361]